MFSKSKYLKYVKGLFFGLFKKKKKKQIEKPNKYPQSHWISNELKDIRLPLQSKLHSNNILHKACTVEAISNYLLISVSKQKKKTEYL